MGWLTTQRDGKEVVLGDEEWDRLHNCLEQVVRGYQKELKRKPRLDEMIALFQAVLSSSQMEWFEDSAKKVLVDLQPKLVKRIKEKLGDQFGVPLGDGQWGYGKVLIIRGNFSWIGFYNLRTEKLVSPGHLKGRKLILKLDCGTGIDTGEWPLIGWEPVTKEESVLPVFQHIDALDEEIVYRVTIDEKGNYVRKRATLQEVKRLPLDGIGSIGAAVSSLKAVLDGKKIAFGEVSDA